MDIDSLTKLFADDLARARSEAELRALRDKYLSRKNGLMSGFMKAVAASPAEQRPALGQAANQLKQQIDATLTERLAQAAAARPAGDAIDVTLPGRAPLLGHRHPLTLLRERVESIFLRMGFLIVEGPELEDDYHNFEALNMPAEHPARDMQDTLYLATPVPSHGGGRPATLLRTHTSGMQIRYMEAHQPPIRLIAPGRVYRRDGLDLTHSPMFTQVEALVVGDGITLADLKGTLIAFARELFGPDRKTRFRPSFFPYTEPSGELDISCVSCGGTGRVLPKPGTAGPGEGGLASPKPDCDAPGGGGLASPKPDRDAPGGGGLASPKPDRDAPGGGGCPMCKHTGWIEVLGSGMVHPAVFEAVGYDAERYTGFAFGVGIERLALLKWGVEDIRLFYENDLRFLEQFPL